MICEIRSIRIFYDSSSSEFVFELSESDSDATLGSILVISSALRSITGASDSVVESLRIRTAVPSRVLAL